MKTNPQFLTKENLDNLKKEWDYRETKRVSCPIEWIDRIFPNMFLGELYMVYAPTGTGKSSFLLATARKYAEQVKVLFITTEENDVDLSQYFPEDECPNLAIYYVTGNLNTEIIKNFTLENDIHYVFFDYMGATGEFEWNKLKEKADELCQIALQNDFLIFSAGQADNSIYEEKKDPNLKFTGNYISFSKHMLDKCAGAFYLTKDPANPLQLFAYPIKYRHGCLTSIEIPISNLRFKNRTWD